MLAAMTVTSLSSRIWAEVCSAMISRRRRSNKRGPPALDMIVYLLDGIELISGVERAHRQFHIFLGNQHADLDLGGRDHLDVDALIRQGPEHGLRHAGMGAH